MLINLSSNMLGEARVTPTAEEKEMYAHIYSEIKRVREYSTRPRVRSDFRESGNARKQLLKLIERLPKHLHAVWMKDMLNREKKRHDSYRTKSPKPRVKSQSSSRTPGAPKSFYVGSEDIRLPSILISKLQRGAEAQAVYAKYVILGVKGKLDNADKVRMIRASNTANKVIGMINKFMISKGYDIDGLDLILVSREYVLIKDSGMHKVRYRLVS